MKTHDLVLRCGSKTLHSLTKKLSGRGKKYAKLVDECEEDTKASKKKLRKNSNSAQPDLSLMSKNKRSKNISKPDKESEDEDDNHIIDVATEYTQKRRCAICEEIEKGTFSDSGMNLRHFREFLVTHHLLVDLNLM